MTVVLALDQGTSATKAIVVDGAGEVLALAEVTLHPRYLDGGGVEQDPEALLDSVLVAGRRAVAEAGVAISAVALANQGETVLAWDRATGRPLSPAIVWQDSRARVVCEARRESAPRVAELTGLVLDPYFSAPKMRWLRDHVTTEGVVTTTDTWLVHRLCGAFVTDASTASRSLVLDVDMVDWSRELLTLFGLDDESLPEIVASDDVVGTTSLFGGEVPVTGLVVDQQAALLAEACLEAGTAKCTFGTGAFLLAQLGPRAVRSTAGLTTSVAWRLRGRHVVLHRRAGVHRRLGRAVGHGARSGGVRRPARRRRGRHQRRRAVRAGAGRSGRAVVGLPRHGLPHRDDVEHRSRAGRARSSRRHRRPGRDPHRPGRR